MTPIAAALTTPSQGIPCPAPPSAGRARRITGLVLLAGLCGAIGCNIPLKTGTDLTGIERGITFYVGGAGPFGQIGNNSVPRGLRDAGYEGAIEVFPWQSMFGGTLRDQLDYERNRGEGKRLAKRIRAYLHEYPERPVNLIGLSAGTGIITFALEELPPEYEVNQVVFLASSLSRAYDLAPALGHVRGRLWNFYSSRDPILRYLARFTGSVDREFAGTALGGLEGFAPPPDADDETRLRYRLRVRNVGWREEYKAWGWDGLHTTGTSAAFIEHAVAPALLGRGEAHEPPVASTGNHPAPPE